jgi:hypothetical protein
MPRRRLSLVVAAGALAVAALAGCQVEPGNAAFVSGSSFSKAGLDHVVDQYKSDGGKVDATDEGAVRAEIARDQVFVDVASRYAREQGYGSPTVDTSQVEQGLGVPASDLLVQLIATRDAYRSLLLSKATAVDPTDAELHAVYDLLAKQGLPLSYADATTQVRQLDGFGQAIAVRRELTDAMRRYGVRMNPLYDSTFVVMTANYQGQQIAVVGLPLASGTGSPAVRDVSS